MTERIHTHKVVVICALGRRGDTHAILDRRIGILTPEQGGGPSVRLSILLEHVALPGVAVAWICYTGARAAIYGPEMSPALEELLPGVPDLEQTILTHLRKGVGDLAPSGYAITHQREPGSAWEQLLDRRAWLATHGLRPLTGTAEELADEHARVLGLE